MLRCLILSILLLSFLFFAAAPLASFWHVAYYGVVYPSSVESLPPRGANLTIILRGGAVQGWNSGSYYKPGWSLNSGRTRYLQWWPPKSKFFESWHLSDSARSWRFHLPLWTPIALVATIAASCMWLEWCHQRGTRRHRRGLCSRCSYNLAELGPDRKPIEATRCPECGAADHAAAG